MTQQFASLHAQFGWLARLLSGCDGVELTPETLRFKSGDGTTTTLRLSDLKTFPSVTHGFFGDALTLNVPQHGTLRVPFLPRRAADPFVEALTVLAAENLAREAEEALAVYERLAVKTYLRHSNEAELREAAAEVAKHFPSIRQHVQPHWNAFLFNRMAALQTLAPFNAKTFELLRKRYVEKRLATRQTFYDKVESNPLTEQQRLAVVRNDDVNLVLAAAGTGKTSVMVAKALDLIESGDAKPEDVLVLAFNKEAADELGERAQKRARQLGLSPKSVPHFATFHALGRRIVLESGHSVALSPYAEHPSMLNGWLDRFIKAYLAAGRLPIDKFARLAFSPVDPFSFSSEEEYQQYLSDNHFVTLRGTKVRGYQEVLIANWLIIHRIPFEYEPSYPLDLSNPEEQFDYRPDFYLTKANIYLEHFGIDRDGKTRHDIDAKAYNETMKKKRRLHARHGTTLIETYHYDWKEGKLEDRLAALMAEHGVETHPMTQDEVLEELQNAKLYSGILHEFLQCLLCIRREGFSLDDVKARLEARGLPEPMLYATFLMDLVEGYEKTLRDDDQIDYDDMINEAISAMESGQFRPRWTHILVDEFQDISDVRLDFLKTLIAKGPRPRFTAVGDDWQAIYRFAGGNLALTTDFAGAMGPHTLTKIETTYRYDQAIADVAGHFVMTNPAQYKKSVVSKLKHAGPSVVVLDNRLPEGDESDSKHDRPDDLAVCQNLIREIRSRDPEARIAIINRYNEPLKNLKYALQDPSLQFWTCHGSKGLEADYCLITGLHTGSNGFPSRKRAHALLEALLPAPGLYPDGEERRLFYVAMTRAKKTCYLIMDPKAPSSFVLELRDHPAVSWQSRRLAQESTPTQTCPSCHFGKLVERDGPYGRYLQCSRHPYCQYSQSLKKAVGKASTGRTSSVQRKSTGSASRSLTRVCEKCGRTMRIRKGPYGEFWGCDGFRDKVRPCRHTLKLRHR